MIEFRPIICRKKHIALIEKTLNRFLYDNFLLPIIEVVKPIKGYDNSLEEDIIIHALREGKIQYINGAFRGKFDAKLTKALYSIGAKWNKHIKAFVISRNKLPMEIIGAIGASVHFAMAVRTALKDLLSYLTIENVLPDLKEILDIPLDTVLEDLEGYALSSFRAIGKGSTAKTREELQKEHARALTEKQIGQLNFFKPKSTTEKIRETISVNPKLTEEQRNALKDEYIQNVSLSIKNFTDEQIISLRELVEKNTREGLNNTTLIKEIQKRFNTTLNKAKFLARNETEIFTAKFYELKCRKLGITHYKWLATGDERTRPMHKMLAEESKKGTVYRFDDPPVTDVKGNRNNPGEDYNCRCVAVGVMSV